MRGVYITYTENVFMMIVIRGQEEMEEGLLGIVCACFGSMMFWFG